MAGFFVQGFGMTIAQERPGGVIDLTDGVVNITLLPANGAGATGSRGIDHLGFTVTDETEARRQIEAAGGTEMNTINMGNAHYEVKYRGPEGIVVDIGHWVGTEPVEEEAPAATPAGS